MTPEVELTDAALSLSLPLSLSLSLSCKRGAGRQTRTGNEVGGQGHWHTLYRQLVHDHLR